MLESSESEEETEKKISDEERELEETRQELKRLKTQELDRISREFIWNNYGIKYNTNEQEVLNALVGANINLRESENFIRAKAKHKLKTKVQTTFNFGQ